MLDGTLGDAGSGPTRGGFVPGGMGNYVLRCALAGRSTKQIISSMRPSSPRVAAMATLPRDAGMQIDTEAIAAGSQRLSVVANLLSQGLKYSLPDWIPVLDIYSEATGQAGNAKRSMHIGRRSERAVPERSGVHMPVFATWEPFSFGIRELLASQRAKAPLDTTMVGEAVRNCNELFEAQALYGAPDITVQGSPVYGLLTEPNINLYTNGSNETWLLHDGQEILDDVLGMIQMANDNRKYGPFTIAVGSQIGLKLQNNFSTLYPNLTIQGRLEQIDTGSGNRLKFVTGDMIPVGATIMYQATTNVVRVVYGQAPTPVSWSDPSGGSVEFLVIGCIITQVRSDQDGNSGVVVGTASGTLSGIVP